jgi:hypothetical protein
MKLFVLTAAEIGTLFFHLFGLYWDNYCLTVFLGCPNTAVIMLNFFLD